MKTHLAKLARHAAFLLMLTYALAARADGWPKLSPFTDVKCQTNAATVTYLDHQYEVISINDQPVGEILDFCRKTYDDLWEKRFVEDLVQVLDEMKHPMAADQTVKLVLKDKDGKITTMSASMTEENRHVIMEKRLPKPADKPASSAAPSSQNEAAPVEQNLSAALDDFENLLTHEWSYYEPSRADFATAIGQLRVKLAGGMSENEFGIELQKILALGMDGHAEVYGYTLPGECLPFLIEPVGERFVAFKEDRSALLDPEHPYLSGMDGKPMAEWLRAGATLSCRGTSQYVAHESLRALRHIQYFRKQMGLATSPVLRVQLESADGRSSMDREVSVAPKMPVYGTWPRTESRLLQGNIGYLRIAEMDDDAVKNIRQWMPRFREARGLIVDVRDNGGGSREALRLLYSYFTQAEDAPKVVTTAVYRRSARFTEDPLSDRFMYEEASPEWNAAERTAIGEFRASFHPQWQPPARDFSAWHYLVLTRLNDDEVYYFSRPVVVLMNEKCFSATDIFLTGLKGLPQVRLVGTTSGGGSSRPEVTPLKGSHLSVRLGSMLSFEAGGNFFDQHGTTPDLTVEPDSDYFVGGRDEALETATTLISQEANAKR